MNCIKRVSLLCCAVIVVTFSTAGNSQTILPNFVSSNTYSLIDSYRDLLSQTNIKSCTYDNTGNPASNPKVKGSYYCTYNAMPAKGYNKGTAGFVSYASWYWYDHTDPKTSIPFHTAWFSSDIQANAVLCTDCWPKPIVNPFDAETNMDNHVFQVVLVPVAAYQAKKMKATLFSQAEDATNPFASIQVKASDIKQINEVYAEKPYDYMSKFNLASFQNPYSSVGIICDVLMKNGNVVKCYVFNNYDGGTMMWKRKV
jgi:hypothetical protein